MRSVDRVFCSLNKQMPDTTPCMPVLDTYHTPKLLGLKLREAYLDCRKMAESQLEAYRRYGVDGVEIGLGPSDNPESMLGCRVIYPEDDVPIFTDPPIRDAHDIDKIRSPQISRKQLIPIDIICRKIGNAAFVLGVVSAPFEYACILHGFHETLRDLRLNPILVKDMLKRTTEISKVIGEELISKGAHGIKIKDSVAASTILSPADYRVFAQPYEREVIKSFRKIGSMSILHICTDSTPILKDMVRTTADALEIDHLVNLGLAKRLVGFDVCIKGNLAPVDLILRKSPSAIAKVTRDAISSAASGGGFIVSTGDSVPRDSPFENVLAMVEATRKYALSSSS